MSVELHLPDLPEVPISLGPAARPSTPRAPVPWHVRLRETLSAYLPLLLMLALALASWWLVKNTPLPAPPARPQAARIEPDYTMRQFALERFDPTGRLVLRIEGALLRHFPDTDRIEVEGARIQAFAPDGRPTVATAARALGNGDGSEVQLLGGAEVRSSDRDGVPIVIRSEFLHAFLVTERLVTNRPVRVVNGASEITAGGLEYDHAAQRMELLGPVRAVLAPRVAARSVR